jgi:hypothetical protein
MGSIGFSRADRSGGNAPCSLSCVRIESHFTAFRPTAIDSVKRLLRVHAQSLVPASKPHRRDSSAIGCNVTDVGQCRIIVNALRREIDRLIRGIDHFPETRIVIVPMPRESRHDDAPPQAIDFVHRSWRNGKRPVYAVAPIGAVPLGPHAQFRATISNARGMRDSETQAVGSVVDVLA